MIFVGDVAIAAGDRFDFVGFPAEFARQPLCINLEGAIATGQTAPVWGVYNTPEWVGSFTTFRLGPVFAGNNHILDVSAGIEKTRCFLEERGLQMFGAGKHSRAAAAPVTVSSSGIDYVLLGFGWPVIGCVAASRGREGVNEFEGANVRSQVHAALRCSGGARVVVIVHGNYEFELYPQPGHRALARQLIADGAHAVIFHHPHVVGPVERYRGRTIAYSLGNWAFSYGSFFGGKLKFSRVSFPQIALELGPQNDVVHHARFAPPNCVRYERSESAGASCFSLRPEFAGMDDRTYAEWFRLNRVKRKLLPIYRSADRSVANTLRDAWVSVRQCLIDSAARTGLKRGRAD